MKKNLIFVGGINRSGTTLLNGLLCSAEGTNPLIHESSYLKSIISAYHTGLIKYEEHSKYYFNSKQHLLDFSSRIFSDFIKLTREKYGNPDTLILKHPPLTPNFPYIYCLAANENINVQFIIVVRDPRDVIASLLRVKDKLKKSGDPEWVTLPRDMRKLSEYYNMTYQPALTYQDNGYKNSLVIIKYEDLVCNPDTTANIIKDRTGIAIPDIAIRNGWTNSEIDVKKLESDNNSWVSDGWGKGVTQSMIGTYKKSLSEQEVMEINQYCNYPMKMFGYL